MPEIRKMKKGTAGARPPYRLFRCVWSVSP